MLQKYPQDLEELTKGTRPAAMRALASCAQFQWPQLTDFNWALDHFDVIARGNDNPALWIVQDGGAHRRHVRVPDVSGSCTAERSAIIAPRWSRYTSA